VHTLHSAGLLHEDEREVDGLAVVGIDVQSDVGDVVEQQTVFVAVIFLDLVRVGAD